MLLDLAGDGVEVAGADVAGGLAPAVEGFACGGDRDVHVLCRAFGDPGEGLAVGGVGALEVLPAGRLAPFAADEEAERLALGYPVEARLARFRRGAVFHCLEYVGYGCHSRSPLDACLSSITFACTCAQSFAGRVPRCAPPNAFQQSRLMHAHNRR